MKTHGTLFQADMIRALQRKVDPKTQTRRLGGLEEINAEADAWSITWQGIEENTGRYGVQFDQRRVSQFIKCKYSPGDLIYAKETFAPCDCIACKEAGNEFHMPAFRADNPNAKLKWTSSIFMPKRLARIWLRVTSVRCERLKTITEQDAMDEGVSLAEIVRGRKCWHASGRAAYQSLWDSINTEPETQWDKSPWVWRVSFEQVAKPVFTESRAKNK